MANAWRRRLRAWAIPNLTFGIIVCQVVAYLLQNVQPEFVARMEFDRQAILAGEVWRIGTFLFTPPSSQLLWTLFFLWCFYFFGTAVEAGFGTVGYNGYLLLGWVATAAVGMIVPGGAAGNAIPGGTAFLSNNAFLYATVFLAFSQLYPEVDVYIFALIPVKAKWLGLIAWIGYFLAFADGTWQERAMIVASLSNFFAYFGRGMWHRMRAGQRRTKFAARVRNREDRPFHICQVCGITDRSHPQTDFRYCSQCVGQRGYCTEHLRNHVHVVDPQAPVSLTADSG